MNISLTSDLIVDFALDFLITNYFITNYKCISVMIYHNNEICKKIFIYNFIKKIPHDIIKINSFIFIFVTTKIILEKPNMSNLFYTPIQNSIDLKNFFDKIISRTMQLMGKNNNYYTIIFLDENILCNFIFNNMSNNELYKSFKELLLNSCIYKIQFIIFFSNYDISIKIKNIDKNIDLCKILFYE